MNLVPLLFGTSHSRSVYFASKHADSGGIVHLQCYLSMPHAFVLFEKHPCTIKCYEELAKFVEKIITGKKIDSRMEIVNGKGVIAGALDLEKYPVAFSKSEVNLLPNTYLTRRSSQGWKVLYPSVPPG